MSALPPHLYPHWNSAGTLGFWFGSSLSLSTLCRHVHFLHFTRQHDDCFLPTFTGSPVQELFKAEMPCMTGLDDAVSKCQLRSSTSLRSCTTTHLWTSAASLRLAKIVLFVFLGFLGFRFTQGDASLYPALTTSSADTEA